MSTARHFVPNADCRGALNPIRIVQRNARIRIEGGSRENDSERRVDREEKGSQQDTEWRTEEEAVSRNSFHRQVSICLSQFYQIARTIFEVAVSMLGFCEH